MSAHEFTLWYVIVGALLVAMALSGSVVKRLPLSTSMLYLFVGAALGPWGAGLIRADPLEYAGVLERLTELAVIVSLFAAGLKLRVPLSDRRWWMPVRLAFLSMAVTVGLIAVAGVLLLGLDWGPAVLLGAVLAPTDPVLASDVQVEHPADCDRLRFGLTGEAGLNDGTAFPFVMLGLGLCGVHEIGPYGLRWLAVDVVWAIVGGLAIGAAAGTGVARLALHVRRRHREAVGLAEFLALGLLALAYGTALLCHTYGFLAAFAAGLALRRVEANETGDKPGDVAAGDVEGPAAGHETHPRHAPAHMAGSVLQFNEQLERITEVAVVVLLGGMLTAAYLPPAAIWFAPLLFVVLRPAAVLVGLWRVPSSRVQRGLTCWFGVRGVGSVYYLTYAIERGIDPGDARDLAAITLTTVAASIVLHGTSVTPLMNMYRRISGRRDRGREGGDGSTRRSRAETESVGRP